MKRKKITSKISMLTADDGMMLTQYIDGVGDIRLYYGTSALIAVNSICNTYREITYEQHLEYSAARDALLALETGEGNGEGDGEITEPGDGGE